jgi:hypothetical protein
MMSAQQLGQLGGVFAILVFWHFFADWVFQSHKEALAKAKNWVVRAWHCTIYTVLFWPLFLLVSFHGPRAGIATALLFTSHFIIDTYVPVMLWAKYLRRAPQFNSVGKVATWSPDRSDKKPEASVTYKTDVDAFKAMAGTPLGLVLMITMDQFFHVAFLLPVTWLMINP